MAKWRRFHWKRWAMVAAALGLFALTVAVLRPQFLAYAEDLVQQTASYALYDAMTDSIYQSRSEYAGLVVLERDSESGVTALRTDGILANRLKAETARAVYDALDRLEQTTLSVPLGNLVLPGLFAGRGPSIPVGIVGLGYADAEFLSAFTAAGINQTRHQVILEVTAQVRLLSPLGGRTVQVENRLAVSDTVIVGNIPEQYTYIDDTEQSILGKVVDYGLKGD